MVTIYIQDKPLIICHELEEPLQKKFLEKQLILLNNPSIKLIPEILSTFTDTAIHGYVWQSANPDKVFQQVASQYEHWEAAGGLVKNKAGECLLMFRRGHWDLPKGKLDPDETLEECALREIKEETGLFHIHIEKPLTDTWHVYSTEDKNILKQTHWYAVTFTGSELTVPQIDEDIIDIQWIKPEHIRHYLKYSYPNILEVFRSAGMDH